MSERRFTLPKQERIASEKLLTQLFSGENSRSISAYPLRVVYMKGGRKPDEAPTQMMVSVPKRHFKHAVDRNRVKRQVRESFRLHKHMFDGKLQDGERLLMAFLWLSAEHQPSEAVEHKMVNLMRRIAERL